MKIFNFTVLNYVPGRAQLFPEFLLINYSKFTWAVNQTYKMDKMCTFLALILKKNQVNLLTQSKATAKRRKQGEILLRADIIKTTPPKSRSGRKNEQFCVLAAPEPQPEPIGLQGVPACYIWGMFSLLTSMSPTSWSRLTRCRTSMTATTTRRSAPLSGFTWGVSFRPTEAILVTFHSLKNKENLYVFNFSGTAPRSAPCPLFDQFYKTGNNCARPGR